MIRMNGESGNSQFTRGFIAAILTGIGLFVGYNVLESLVAWIAAPNTWEQLGVFLTTPRFSIMHVLNVLIIGAILFAIAGYMALIPRGP